MDLKTFECMQYFEYYDTDDINIIIERVEELTQLSKYALIVHDKDVENDKIKGKHFHCVVTLKNRMSIEQVSKILKVEKQYINKIKTTSRKAFEYLIHLNDKDKYQYNPNSVYSNFDYIEYIQKSQEKVTEIKKVKDICNKIASGEIKQYNLHECIDVNLYAKYKNIFNNAFEYRTNAIKEVNRDMMCVYIFGESGTGKTSYAKEYQKYFGKAYISSSGKHLLDDYKGESLIILDDIRASDISVSELLKLLDNNTNSLVNCRYYNKSIYECKLIVLTSTIGPYAFFKQCKDNNDEDVKQLIRRLKYSVYMTKDKIHILKYDEKQENLQKEISTTPNMVLKYYQKVQNDDNELLDKMQKMATEFGK